MTLPWFFYMSIVLLFVGLGCTLAFRRRPGAAGSAAGSAAGIVLLIVSIVGILVSLFQTFGVPWWFVLGFLVFIGGFGSLIAFAAKKLGGNVSGSLHGLIEGMLIAGILGGVIALFQPFAVWLYNLGFHVLLVSVLGFTLWSHIAPRMRKA